MMQTTRNERIVIMAGWGALCEWSSPYNVGPEIKRAFWQEMKSEGVWPARCCVMSEFRDAYWNRNRPIMPSALHMRPALIRLYTAVSYEFNQFREADRLTMAKEVMPKINNALTARDAALERMVKRTQELCGGTNGQRSSNGEC